MINSILELIKKAIQEAVDRSVNISEEKKEQVVNVATSTLGESLGNNVSLLSELLSGDSSSTVDNLKGSVVSALIDKVGLSGDIAGQVSSSLVTAVLDVLKHAMEGRKPLSLDSLADVVTGISSSKNKKGGLLNTIVSFLKK